MLLFSACSDKESSEETDKLDNEILGEDGVQMLLIPAGEFRMGSNDGDDDEMPVHTVYLDAFYMDKYEVTNAQYKKFMDTTGHKEPKYWNDSNYNAPNHPVVGVTWDDAQAYCWWAEKRLPTEAEWEKAARGGFVGRRYPWGDKITHDNANFSGASGRDIWDKTSPVGSFAPNGYGLYDIMGNVSEWCRDFYLDIYYKYSPKSNPTGPSSLQSEVISGKYRKAYRVTRGGSWRHGDFRTAERGNGDPFQGDDSTGFRCVLGTRH